MVNAVKTVRELGQSGALYNKKEICTAWKILSALWAFEVKTAGTSPAPNWESG